MSRALNDPDKSDVLWPSNKTNNKMHTIPNLTTPLSVPAGHYEP